jgi:hypothetical protein
VRYKLNEKLSKEIHTEGDQKKQLWNHHFTLDFQNKNNSTPKARLRFAEKIAFLQRGAAINRPDKINVIVDKDLEQKPEVETVRLTPNNGPIIKNTTS